MSYPGSLAERALDHPEPRVVDDMVLDPQPIVLVLPGSCGSCTALLMPLLAEKGKHLLFTLRVGEA